MTIFFRASGRLRKKKSQILQDFQRQMCGKSADFTGILQTFSRLPLLKKIGKKMANFVGKFRYKLISFALIWLSFIVFLTEIIIAYFNNKVLEK